MEDETDYLQELVHRRLSIIHYKILYEYQRKNGSLIYWLYDKRPLLSTGELMRRFPDEERGGFIKYCQQLEAAEKSKFDEEVKARNAKS